MPAHKTSIAIDDDLLKKIDRAARERGESRNRFVVKVLSQAVRARRDVQITKRLNELFADEELQQEQLKVAEELGTASSYGTDDQW
ncbi:MAG: ribbon-helix-helix protein, CopG family [Deltaproteobacteria bacterium]|nr:ribbon-helix-helix protein, CopG family [Deltaproteobacteria bacterium]MBW1870947.1 ribbon-helix-helix protein, CopG family [Deltaproteobacteria bacterium]